MKTLGDSIALTGQPLSDSDLVTYILNGLGYDCALTVFLIQNQREPWTLQEVKIALLSHES